MAENDKYTAVPYVVFESAQARNERTVKKLVIALVVAVVLMFATNVAWLVYESQFEYGYSEESYEQEGDTNIIGDGNEVTNGAEVYP